MKISILVPTRGLLFTRTAEYIESLKQKYGEQIKIYYSHDLPIPQGHNFLTEKALGDGNDLFLFLEEDVVPPAGAFEKMLALDADIVSTDYDVVGWGCITKNTKGEILWCGLGATMVKRKVFEALEKPWFRVDKVLSENDWTWKQLPEEYIRTKNYGTLDIWFCCQARAKGFIIKEVEGEIAIHLRLDELGKKGTNNGCHIISERKNIIKHQIKNMEL